jgi:hypothetical protein
MVVRGNEVHHNYGAGIWFDGFNSDAQIYQNIIYDNYRWGISWELSYGGAAIHHNTLIGNGIGDGTANEYNAQLAVANSDGGRNGIEVYANRIDGTAYPLVLIDSGSRPIRTENVHVHDNVITFRSSTARVGGFGEEVCAAAAGNRYENNAYRIPVAGGKYWAWNSQLVAWTEWKAMGHDRSGWLS